MSLPSRRKTGHRTKSGRLSRAGRLPARDAGTAELQAKRTALVGSDKDPALSSTMLGVLFARGQLSQESDAVGEDQAGERYRAGERFRALRCALYGPPWPSNVLSFGMTEDDRLVKIQRDFDRMVRLLDAYERSICNRVCVYDQNPGKELPVLVRALSKLAGTR